MTEKQQIEEIMRDMENACCIIDVCPDDVEICEHCKAKTLYKQGYRKIPKDAVVLTKEEYETLCFNLDEYKRNGQRINDMYGQCLMERNLRKDEIEKLKVELAQARKETAKEILKAVKEKAWAYQEDEDEWEITQTDLDELAKQYGVEVEQ